ARQLKAVGNRLHKWACLQCCGDRVAILPGRLPDSTTFEVKGRIFSEQRCARCNGTGREPGKLALLKTRSRAKFPPRKRKPPVPLQNGYGSGRFDNDPLRLLEALGDSRRG